MGAFDSDAFDVLAFLEDAFDFGSGGGGGPVTLLVRPNYD